MLNIHTSCDRNCVSRFPVARAKTEVIPAVKAPYRIATKIWTLSTRRTGARAYRHADSNLIGARRKLGSGEPSDLVTQLPVATKNRFSSSSSLNTFAFFFPLFLSPSLPLSLSLVFFSLFFPIALRSVVESVSLNTEQRVARLGHPNNKFVHFHRDRISKISLSQNFFARIRREKCAKPSRVESRSLIRTMKMHAGKSRL